MKIAVFSKQSHLDVGPLIGKIIEIAGRFQVEVIVNDSWKKYAETYTAADLQADFLISLGGDGTFLETITLVKEKGIPVIGINTGRLGFLATMSDDDLEIILTALVKGNYILEHRSLLYLESDAGLFGNDNIALNDIVVHKKETSSMITVHAYLNGDYLNTYWADGLIVATPTGSTGYSLSCGGPIIFPSSHSFALTAVSPHHLNVRPVIIPDDAVISFEVDSRGANFLISLDSRSMTIDSKIQLAVRKASFDLQILKIRDRSYIDTLRRKMGWGLDYRN